ncbi:MAG: Crp/Fnr family transcriptional regulator [Hyphomonadaceae bacterium]
MSNILHFKLMLDLIITGSPAFMTLLPDHLAEEIRHAASLVAYDGGQLIHSRGDKKPGISIVKSGGAHAGVYGADGSFVMTSILGPGQTFGEFTLFAGLPRTHDMTAASATEIYQLSASRFLALYEREPDISRALLSASLIRTHLLLEMMDAMRRLPMLERTAKVLLTMLQTAGNIDVFEYRQSDLAFTLGVSRMSLSKALKQLVNLGLIKTGYGQITLPDPDKMRNWVDRHCGKIS